MPNQTSKLVWSSTQGDLRKQPTPQQTVTPSIPPQQQTVYLHRESKGRSGSGVTLLKGLALTPPELATLAKTIKQACGVGGTVKKGVIEIQSQDREKIAEVLKKLGYKVKLAGG